jgi:CBS domain containing-hemolysin-like protein
LGEPARPVLVEVDASATVGDVEARSGLTLPAGQSGTVGGRLAELIGRIPVTGERHVIAGIEFDVLQASPTRAERIVIRPARPTPPAEPT